MKEQIYSINLGTRFGTSVSLYGIILIIIGLVFIAYSFFIITWVLVFIGIVISFDSFGYEFNVKNETFRRYDKFLFFKLGASVEDLQPFKKLVLKRTNETVTKFSRSGEKVFSQKTFDVYLISENKEILLLEFKRHSSARKFLKELSEKLGVESYDEVKVIQDKSIQRRKTMRRK